MTKSINRLMPILFAGMFMYAGCAKQEVVKKDEPLVPAVAAQPSQVAPTAKALDKPTTVTSSPVGSDKLKKMQQTDDSAATADLQKAFEKIYFDFDSSTLSGSARQSLAKNLALLKQNPQARMKVEGHCDERGSDEYNLALGELRAQAAVRYLTTMGIPAERLTSISYGKEKPADPGHDEAAWAKNRRDEFVISK